MNLSPRVAERPLVELGRSVEEGVKLIDLEERPLRLDARQETLAAFADANGVPLDQLVVHGALENLTSSLSIALIEVFESGRRRR